MNFLSLRSQLQNWTLNSDDKLYRAIKQLSDTVLEAEKVIMNNIQTTRYEVIKGNVQSGCSYNHYLRISQTKFTENKIGEKISQEKKQNNVTKVQARNKMDIFKQAIQIGVKNLQITEQKGVDNDLVSQSDTSLSQSIYKDCRIPAIYGTKQFAMNSFLNLFVQNQLNALVPTEEFQTNQLVVNQMQQNQNILPPPPSIDGNLLPPPPPLNTVLNTNYSNSPASLPSNLPIPPPLNLPTIPSLSGSLPPPPPLNTIPPPPSLNGLLPPPLTSPNNSLPNLPVPPPLNFNLPTNSNNQQIPTNMMAQELEKPIAPISKPKQPLSVQQQLALRLKYGKDYKKQVEVQQPKSQENTKFQNNYTGQMKLSEITQQRQSSEIDVRSSLRSSYKGIDFNPLVNSFSNPISQKTRVTHDQPQQQQVDALFGPSKNKNKQSKRPTIMNAVENDIMKRQTFNEDILFKKKAQPEKKQIPKPKNTLFGDDNQQQQIQFSFKKKQKKQQIKIKSNPISNPVQKQVIANKKRLLDSQSDNQDSSALFNKKMTKKPPFTATTTKVEQPIPTIKVEPPVTTEKKTLNPLFKPSQPSPQKEVKIQQTPSIKKTNNNFLNVQQQNEQKMERSTSNMSTTSNHGTSYAMKAAAAGRMGMMGLGMPLMPKGMVLTKPSQTKRNEQQAKLRQKQQEQRQRLARQQEQRLLQIQRQQQQIVNRQRLQAQKRRIQQQKRIRQQQQIQRKQQQRLQQIKRLQQQQYAQKAQQKIFKRQSQIKIPEKPKPSPIKPQQKRNVLFDDDQDQDIFKPKPKKINNLVQQYVQKKIATQTVQQNISLSPPILSVPKQQQKIVQKPIPSSDQLLIQPEASKNQLSVRRKKAKPTLKSQLLFDDDEQGDVIKNVPIPTNNKPKFENINPSLDNLRKEQQQQQRKKALKEQLEKKKRDEQAQRLRIQQQEYEKRRRLQEAKRQQQRRQQIRRQEQRIYQAKREKERLQQLRRQQQAQRLKIQQQKRYQEYLRKKRLQQQQARRQQQKLQQIRLQQLRLEQERRQQQRIQQEARLQQYRRKQRQEQQRRFLQQQRKRQRQQYERQQRIRRQQQAEFQRLRKERQVQQARIRQMQIDEERKRIQQSKKQQMQPLSQPGPFLPKLPTRSNQPLGGPLGGPLIPSLPKTSTKQPLQSPISQQPKKNTLFDDEQQSDLKFSKSTKQTVNKPTTTTFNNQKKGLFGDEDDDLDNSNFLSSKPIAQKSKPQVSKPSLYKEQDDYVPQLDKNKPKTVQNEPIKQPIAAKKKSLFDDDDDDLSGNTFLNKPAVKNQSVSPSIQQISPQKQPPILQGVQKQPAAQQKKKNLFDDDDDDDFLSKKSNNIPQKSTVPTSNPVQKNQPARVPPAATTQAKKKNLFEDSGSDDDFIGKKKPAQRKPF